MDRLRPTDDSWAARSPKTGLHKSGFAELRGIRSKIGSGLNTQWDGESRNFANSASACAFYATRLREKEPVPPYLLVQLVAVAAIFTDWDH